MLYLTLTPSPPQIKGPLGWDKLLHAVAMGITALIAIQVFTSYGIGRISSIVAGIVAATLFGGLIEVLQGFLTTSRQADFIDIIADFVGAFAAGSIFVIYPHLRGIR
jgi:VanZ family protein